MPNRLITASLAAGLALTLVACSNEPETVDEMLDQVPAEQDTPIEAAGDLPLCRTPRQVAAPHRHLRVREMEWLAAATMTQAHANPIPRAAS